MRILTLLFLLLSLNGFSQWKSYIIGVKGDTLNRVDLKGRRQGPWVERIENVRGERGYEEQGFYVNGQKEGKWQRFTLEGDLIAIENYKWGYKNGKCVYMNPMGDPLREESWKAVNPEHPYDTVDVMDPDNPGHVLEKRIVKLEGTALKHGVWRYYDPFSGKLEKKEEYIFDRLKTEGQEGAEDDLAPIDVTGAGKKPEYKPKTEEEKKNAGKKKVRVRDGSTF